MQQQKQQEEFSVLIKESLPHKEEKKRKGRGAVGGRPYFIHRKSWKSPGEVGGGGKLHKR